MTKKEPEEQRLLLGAHFSIAGGLHKAIQTASGYGCNVLQVFTKNANTWTEPRLTQAEIGRFLAETAKQGIVSVSSHGAYLINLASPDKDKRRQSVLALTNELFRSAQLGIDNVIIHPGAHLGSGEKAGTESIASAIRSILDALPDNPCRLLLETTAGQGTNLGYTFEQLAGIWARAGRDGRVGFCLDTCHVFAAGYDLRTKKAYEQTFRAFDKIIGLERLFVLHLNDAKKALGSRIDRHEHIGAGTIGTEAFRLIMNDARLRAIPKILETPKKQDGVDYDQWNLQQLRALVRS
jgi:deoxyribonuclease-4